MTATLTIPGRTIGTGHPVYVVAEMSGNHHQSFDRAVQIVRAAKEAGADAIKLQTYTADTLTIQSDKEYFRIGKGTIWEGKTLYDLYGEAYTPWEWQPKLRDVANDLGLDCFSSPFDASAVEFLEEMGASLYKIASFEIVDLPLLRCVGEKRKPVIVSTGMATLPEIEDAVRTLREAGAAGVALLKCTSAYPAPPEEMNLQTIPHLSHKFDCPAGLSDHTLGTTVPVAAVALGASIVEKHLTLSRETPGPDSAFSLEPEEFSEMVNAIRTVEKALGEERYQPTEREKASVVFRRSLFVVKDIKGGEILNKENVRSIRPGYGLPPKHLDEVLGRRAAKDLEAGTPLGWDGIAP
ncbi:MAG: pseudaminic acid synthase [Planctomycetota bacterium]|nr:pseudaminic acid synthase [Planctomycetota bacterium]